MPDFIHVKTPFVLACWLFASRLERLHVHVASGHVHFASGLRLLQSAQEQLVKCSSDKGLTCWLCVLGTDT